MTPGEALCAWLEAQLPIVAAVLEGPIAEDQCPGAVVRYVETRDGDTLGGPHVERYAVALVTRRAGATPETVAADMAGMEVELMDAATSWARRTSDAWEHIEVQRGRLADDTPIWVCDLWVGG